MKANLLLPAILVVVLFSCNNNEDVSATPETIALKTDIPNTCSIENPLIDLDWLIAEVEEIQSHSFAQYSYITQAEYENGTVFIFHNCCLSCNAIVPVRNCSGEEIALLGYGEAYITYDQIMNEQTIWIADDSECN